MKRIFPFLLVPAVMTTSYASAEIYLLVGESDDGHHYVDVDSIARVDLPGRNSTFEAWSKLAGPPGSQAKRAKSLILEIYDCKNKEVSIQAYADYDGDGKLTSSKNFRASEFGRVFPESVGMAKLKFVCDLASRREL